MKKLKYLSKFCLSGLMAFGLVGMSAVTGTTSVHASTKTWSTTLPSATRSVCIERKYYREYAYSNPTPATAELSLTRIVNGPSYYVDAHIIDASGAARTGSITVQQNAGFKPFTNVTMSSGYEHHLVVSNDYFETTARSAYGYINGFFTKD